MCHVQIMQKSLVVAIFLIFSCASKAPSQGLNQNLPAHWVTVKNPYVHDERESFGEKYSIATQGPATSKTAQQIFDMGGNIVDAAVAASFTLGVERPQSTGIGGGGFMLIHIAKENKTYAIDFRERAPLSANERMFLDKDGNVVSGKASTGIYAVGVPGTVAGLVEIHKKFGKLHWNQLFQPAIDLAEKGLVVYPHLASALVNQKDILLKSDYTKSIFYHEDGSPLTVGETLVQKDMAKTLREIQKKGRNGFYKGWVADAILKTNINPGPLTQKDFDNYKVAIRKPVEGAYHGYKIASMPPPSSGGTHIIQILQALDPITLRNDSRADHGALDPKNIHQVVMASQKAFRDRAKYMGDPDFVKDIPLNMLLSPEYAAKSRKDFGDKAIQSTEILKGFDQKEKWESTETSHFSIMDGEGNAVAATVTVNGHFGSGIVVPGTGIVLNNEMEDFTSKPGSPNSFGVISGKANAVAPKKRPLSSMAPTIVFQPDGTPYMVLGTADGTRIISCVVQTLLNDLEYKMSLFDSVSTMRYHHQWFPDEILVESPGFTPETQKTLEDLGYKINSKGWFSCKIQAIRNESGKLHGISDIRGEGLSIGN